MNQQYKMAICARIKKLRKDHGYTQAYICQLLNMEQNSYSRMENGKTNLDIDRLYQLSNIYKIKIEQLLAGTTSSAS